MATNTPRLPEQFRDASSHVVDFEVSELVSDAAGSHSPFGDNEFPLPYQVLDYPYPRPEDRPHLLDGR
jgi:hypothetical protein